MPYTKTVWVSGSTPTDQAEMNNIENGVAGAYTELESITGNDGVVQATTDGPFTLANFVNFILKAIRNITGTTNWYDIPAATIASLNTNKADLSGAAFTGAISGTTATFSSDVTANNAILAASNADIEMGNTSASNTPHIDLHSSGNNIDYDARIIASGGTASNGAGTLNIQAGALQFNGATVSNNSGALQANLNADKLDGLDSTAFAQLASAANFTAGLQSGGKNVLFAQAGLTGKFSAQSTAPASPADGDLWLDTSVVLS